jgi:feruloyl-CoA synthase
MNLAGVPYRPVRVFSSEVFVERRGDGALHLRSAEPLAACDARVGDWLDRWAALAPQRIFLVEQTGAGERSISYGDMRCSVRALAHGLLSFGLDADRPLVTLARNGIDHAVLMLAALYVGIPFAPLAPAYALQSRDFDKLARVLALLTPGLVVIDDGERYAAALDRTLKPGVPVVALRNADPRRGQRPMNELRGADSAHVDQAAARVNHGTLAKFLFTSGSSGISKAVINTQGMLCTSAQMQRQVTAFMMDEPPIMIDWLPWNHTAGGNNIFNMVLHHGGTLYIDPGRPASDQIGPTLELLRRVSPTVYFNVPLGYEILLPVLESDAALRRRFFAKLRYLWYAAAAMRPATWDSLEQLAVKTVGRRILIVTGLGMTETSPVALFGNLEANGPGVVGVPVPGVELKLVPHSDAFEARYRGPNVTPGYWRDPEATAAAFDADGYFMSGDLLSFVDAACPSKGLRFEGRASDDFKLATGTRVNAGALRLVALDHLKPLVTDLVIVGAGRNDVRMLIFPDWTRCATEVKLDPDTPPGEMLNHAALIDSLRERLTRLSATGTGSSNRIAAALLVVDPPSAPAGEITEKGTLNGRFVQRNRPQLLEILFSEQRSPLVLLPLSRADA